MLAIPHVKPARPPINARIATTGRSYKTVTMHPCRSEPCSRFSTPNPRPPPINARIATMGRSYKNRDDASP
jgi:hypothetical protein